MSDKIKDELETPVVPQGAETPGGNDGGDDNGNTGGDTGNLGTIGGDGGRPKPLVPPVGGPTKPTKP